MPEALDLEGATADDLYDVIDQLMERMGGIINEAVLLLSELKFQSFRVFKVSRI
jgi:hypothetical protein